MKKFEFFSFKDYLKHVKLDMTAMGQYEAIMNLLNEECQTGYTKPSTETDLGDICTYIGHRIEKDTHEAAVFLREIEVEKEECDHLIEMVHGSDSSADRKKTMYKAVGGFCFKCLKEIE